MPYLLLTLAALFWGGNYVVGHVLVQGVDPILMTEARWALTALLLGLLYRRQIAGSRHLLRANAPAVVVLTLCGQVSFPLTLYIGLQTTSALNAAIYMSATPSMVLLINRLFFRDPVSGRNWLGVAFSTLGVMILLFQGNPLHAASLHTFAIGDLWAMGSALSWALYCSLLRLKDRRIPANGFVAVSSLLGALILVPIVIFWLMRHPAQDWAAWREPFYLSGLAYLVIFPSWLAYLFWNKGIASIGATRGEIYTHIIPPLRRGVEYPLPAHPAAGLAPVQRAVYHAGDCHLLLEKRRATGRLATPGHKVNGWWRAAGDVPLLRIGSPGLRDQKGQDGNDNRHRPGHQGHCQAVVMPMMLGD